MTPPLPRAAGRRETIDLASFARFLGLVALGRRVRQSMFFRTRERAMHTGIGTLGVAATIALVALLIPASRTPLAAILRAPGTVIGAIVGGSSDDTSVKGYPRLYSTKLDIDLAIRPGDGKAPPPLPIAYVYPNTAPVGQTGNTYLYAHDRRGMFLGLHHAKVGDVVVAELSQGDKHYYQITEIHADVRWNDLEWLQPSQDNRLTLQTCNYSGDFDPRFVVVAKAIPADLGARLAGI
ncbi:MAG TPA: sortase [Candidatus Dormibacteraeota bacterium]|jgi:LPXTG-site transpeptidase (sortase) family protein|nr:sortase [Candidatus Dormibacteraeota bacterium]